MTWQDRLQPTLGLTSPLGSVFTAKWAGDPREKTKKLGIFEFPGQPGAQVQDLSVGASLDKLTFFFDGPDHDTTSREFYDACDEDGAWTIDHPTKGRLAWQLMTVKEEIRPVESGNTTQFKTEWIEPLGIDPQASIPQLSADVGSKSTVVISKAKAQVDDAFVGPIRPSAVTRFKNAIAKRAAQVKKALEPLTQKAAEINAEVTSVSKAITNSLATAVFSATALTGQVQTLVQLPGRIEEDFLTRLRFFGDLLRDVLGSEEDNPTRSSAAVTEATAVTCLAVMANAAALGEATTRQEAIAALELVTDAFDDLTNGLDATQTTLDGAYVSQADTYNDSALLVAAVTELLLRRSFDLAVAKQISLKTPRAPVEIAVTEGIDFDLFISTNRLKGDDILLLPAGREVTVFR